MAHPSDEYVAALAFEVRERLRKYAAENDGKPRGGRRAVARDLGLTEAYVGKLATIMTLPEGVLDHWRRSLKPLPFVEMRALCEKMPEKTDKQEALYQAACKRREKQLHRGHRRAARKRS